MSTVTSKDLRRWAIQSDSEDVLIWLVEITHANLTEAIRASSDMTEFIALHEETKEPLYGTRHQGKLFYTIPFSFTLPEQSEGTEAARATLRVDNVDREYIRAIRDTDSVLLCRVMGVFSSDPDTVQHDFPPFRITSVTYTATSIEGTLMPFDFRYEPVPALNFLPSGNPGMF